MSPLFDNVKKASFELPGIDHGIKQHIISALANKLIENTDEILKENQLDLNLLSPQDPKYDRLLLNQERINAMAVGLKNIAKFPSPIWQTLEEVTLPNGLKLQKKSVPIGVIGMIYESRPNVTLEAFALCFMSSNACVFKGGKEAAHTNEYFGKLIQTILQENSVTKEAICLLPPTRASVNCLLEATGSVDLIIPRGSQALIDFVKQHAAIPIIETGAGVVHTYVDLSANKAMAKKIITNAKTRRLSVCNALDCLILHQSILPDLSFLVSELAEKTISIYADEASFTVLKGHYPDHLLFKVTPLEYGTEFLDAKLAIKVVSDFKEALMHIRRYSSGHSEAIVADNKAVIAQFFQQVDAAVLYANASTAFTDGGEFGMGGEIGISTQKLHVRGPFSMQHLVSTKWLVEGQGQIRP